jgi:hypothetical protein
MEKSDRHSTAALCLEKELPLYALGRRLVRSQSRSRRGVPEEDSHIAGKRPPANHFLTEPSKLHTNSGICVGRIGAWKGISKLSNSPLFTREYQNVTTWQYC